MFSFLINKWVKKKKNTLRTQQQDLNENCIKFG